MTHLITIGIIGNGFVGKATSLFKGDYVKVMVFDVIPDKCSPPGLTLEMLCNTCDLIFLCVPTPVQSNEECHLNIVESVVNDIKLLNSRVPIIVRSTVPPGTCDKLCVYHMPEFLRENTWESDFKSTSEWIIGQYKSQSESESKNFSTQITNLIHHASRDGQISGHTIHWCRTIESELIKYARNAFLATKIAFFNEIQEYSENIGISASDFNIVRELIANDPRIGHSHTHVPGSDGKRGFGGTCLPKDLCVLKTEMNKSGGHPVVIDAVKTRNETIDRPLKDWTLNVGRSVI